MNYGQDKYDLWDNRSNFLFGDSYVSNGTKAYLTQALGKCQQFANIRNAHADGFLFFPVLCDTLSADIYLRRMAYADTVG